MGYLLAGSDACIGQDNRIFEINIIPVGVPVHIVNGSPTIVLLAWLKKLLLRARTRACGNAPACGRCCIARVSGAIIDCFDLIIGVPEVISDMVVTLKMSSDRHVNPKRIVAVRAYATT